MKTSSPIMKQDLARRCGAVFELDQQSHHEGKTHYAMLIQSTSQETKQDQSPKAWGKPTTKYVRECGQTFQKLCFPLSIPVDCPEMLPKAIGSAVTRYVLACTCTILERAGSARLIYSRGSWEGTGDDCRSSKFYQTWSSLEKPWHKVQHVWLGGGDDDKRERLSAFPCQKIAILYEQRWCVDCRRRNSAVEISTRLRDVCSARLSGWFHCLLAGMFPRVLLISWTVDIQHIHCMYLQVSEVVQLG